MRELNEIAIELKQNDIKKVNLENKLKKKAKEFNIVS